MAEYLFPGDEVRPAIKTLGGLRNVIEATSEASEFTPVYVRMVDDHGRDRGDSAILAVVQDSDGALRLVVQR